ncbi:C-terminal helicase domain-containing protein [Sorangium sp. So ce124]
MAKTRQAIAACELLRRRGEARRVLIVTAASLKHQWAQEIARWTGERDRLRVGHAMLHGDVPTDRRPALLDRFRDDPAVRVLLSTDAGGMGLNLQAASYVVHLDLPWNPARLDQRTARAHRMVPT